MCYRGPKCDFSGPFFVKINIYIFNLVKKMKALFFCLFLWAACPTLLEAETVSVLTHGSFNIPAETLAAFEKQTGHKLEFHRLADGGALLSRLILDQGEFDLVYGLDNTLLARALKADHLFAAYESPLAAELDPKLILDKTARLWPVDYGDVVINYDPQVLAQKGLEPPKTLAELTEPQWQGLLVISSPDTSTPGLAFLYLTAHLFGEGENGYLSFWRKLVDNGLFISPSWEAAYYEHFSATSQGKYPLVLSYGTSPATEALSSQDGIAPTKVMEAPEQSFRQIEFVGILKKTKHLAAAQQAVDFMLSKTFQDEVAASMYVLPANKTATIPTVFSTMNALPQSYVADPDLLENKGELWLQQWREAIN